MKDRMTLIKDNRMITYKYLQCLRAWIRCENTAKELFSKKYKATAWNDFDYFNGEVDRDHLVMPSEILLVDRKVEGEHWICIGKISKSKTKQRFKLCHKVIKVDELKFWRAGYWLLPKFYTHG